MSRVIPAGFGELAYVYEGPAVAPYVTTLGISLLGIATGDYQDACDLAYD